MSNIRNIENGGVRPLNKVLAHLKQESLVHDHKYRGASNDEFVLASRT
jgi:hypothetical protein